MNDIIQTYIIDERARGVADSAIASALLAQGWKKEEVDSAFMSPHAPAGNKFTGGMFVGRLSRAKYIPILIVGYVLPVLLFFVMMFGVLRVDSEYMLAIGFVALAFFIILTLRVIGATVRRLHDTGSSGWWTLLFLVNPLGFILSIYLCFKKGDAGGNKYGAVPSEHVSFWQALRGS